MMNNTDDQKNKTADKQQKAEKVKYTHRRPAKPTMLGQNLKAFRERMGWQQTDVAEHLNMTSASVSNWEGSANIPDTEVLRKLCKLFDVTLDELMGFTSTTYRSLSLTERQLIEQYRMLDPHGIQMVSSVMRMEVERMQAEQQRKERKILQLRDYFMPASAGVGEYLPEGDNFQWLNVYETPTTERADLIVHVSGDSMRPTLKDGDRLLIQRTEALTIGELGVFMVNGDGYVKELGKDRLISHNRKFKDIRFSDDDDIRPVGRVLGLLSESDIAVLA